MAESFIAYVKHVQDLQSNHTQLRAEREDVGSQLREALAQVEALQVRRQGIDKDLAQVEDEQRVCYVYPEADADLANKK